MSYHNQKTREHEEIIYVYTNGKTLEELEIVFITNQSKELLQNLPKYNIEEISSTITIEKFAILYSYIGEL